MNEELGIWATLFLDGDPKAEPNVAVEGPWALKGGIWCRNTTTDIRAYVASGIPLVCPSHLDTLF